METKSVITLLESKIESTKRLLKDYQLSSPVVLQAQSVINQVVIMEALRLLLEEKK
jgi:hypothetical protein